MQQRFEIGFFVALLLGASILAYFILEPYLPALFAAVIFAVALHPVFRRICHAFGGRSTLASIITILLLSLVVVAPLAAFGYLAFRDAQGLYFSITENRGGQISAFIDSIETSVRAFAPAAELNVASYAASALRFIVANIGSLFARFANVLLQFFIMILGLFYLLRDGEKLTRALVAISPLRNQHDEAILHRLGDTISAVVKGKLLVALIQGILTGMGFALFGVPSPMLWGAVASVAALVPPIGTSLVIVPGVIYLYFAGALPAAIGLLVWGVVAVGFIDNILGPFLIERQLRIHQFFILLGVLGGIAFWGPIGFLAGPIVVSLLFVLIELYPTIVRNNQYEG